MNSGSPSDGMAHALREGSWKLTFDIQDKPAALYDLAADLGELNNLISDPAQAERFVKETGVDLFAPAVGNARVSNDSRVLVCGRKRKGLG